MVLSSNKKTSFEMFFGSLDERFRELGIKAVSSANHDVASAFKAVKSKIGAIDGGVGQLQEAVEQIDRRIEQVDEKKGEKIAAAEQSLGAFLHDSFAADRRAASIMNAANAELGKQYPWTIPPKPKKKGLLYYLKKAWNAVKGAVKKAVDWIVSTAKKAWNAAKNFIVKHWKAIVKIIVGAVIIAGLAALSVFTGGAAAPLFAVAAKAAATCALTSTAITVVTGVIRGDSFDQIFDAGADSFLIGSITGAVSGFAGAAGSAVASATGSNVLGNLTQQGINMTGKLLAKGASYLIDHNGSLSGFMDEQGFGILKEGGMGMLSAAGDYLAGCGKELLGDVFGGLKESQLGHAFADAYNACAEKLPTLTNMVTNAFENTFGELSWSDLGKLKDPAAFAKGIGSSLIGNIAGQASGALEGFVTNDLNQITGGAVGEVINGVKNSDFGQAISGAYNELSNTIDDIQGKINGIKGDIQNAVTGAVGDVRDQISGALGDIQGKVNGVIGHISDEFKGVAGQFGSVIGDIKGQIGGFVGDIQGQIGGFVGDVQGQIGGFVGDVQGQIGGFVNDIQGQVGDIRQQAGVATGKLSQAVGGIKGNLALAFSGMSGSTVSILMPPIAIAAGNIGKNVGKTSILMPNIRL